MGLQGVFLAAGLHRIPEAFGEPTVPEIMEYLSRTYECDEHVSRNFAKALRFFWQNENEACVNLAVPIVERVCRELLLELDSAIFRVSKGHEIGQFPGLGSLLPSLLQEGFDPSWERFLSTLLTSEGINIRNDVAHGLVDSVSDMHAALVLRAAGLLVTLSGGNRLSAETTMSFPAPGEKSMKWIRLTRRAFLLRFRRQNRR
jgi:hypothetical protein